MEQDLISLKKRAPNYTNSERERLLYIVNDYKDIIENKKTNAVSNKEKTEAWKRICLQFNSSSPSLNYRPVESLKKYYDKMKEDLRKRAAENKKELYKTGGGPEQKDNDKKGDDLLKSIINKKSVEGLGSTFDSNQGGPIIKIDNQNTVKSSAETTTQSNVVILEVEEDPIIQQENTPTCSTECTTYNNSYQTQIRYDEPEKPSECITSETWKKAENLKRPISNVLKKNVDNVFHTMQVKRKCDVPFRRRPNTVVPLTSSRLGDKYELLIDKKLELVNCFKKEHELRMQALELDILLKKRQLTSLPTSKDSNECLLDSQMLF